MFKHDTAHPETEITMNLPLHVRAFSMVVALCITAATVITVAEIGHPPDDGIGAIASLVIRHAAALLRA